MCAVDHVGTRTLETVRGQSLLVESLGYSAVERRRCMPHDQYGLWITADRAGVSALDPGLLCGLESALSAATAMAKLKFVSAGRATVTPWV